MIAGLEKRIDSSPRDAALTIREVASILGIHQNTVRRWSNMGLLKSVRTSYRGEHRFPYRDIMTFFGAFNRHALDNILPENVKGGEYGCRNYEAGSAEAAGRCT